MKAPSISRKRWPIAIALALGAVVLHARQLLGDPLVFRDSPLFFAPAKRHLAEVLKSGELPRWWPWDAGGGPFLAQPMFSTFHPTTLLYAVLPFWSAFALQDVLATATALFGAYALGRAMKLPRPAAFVTAGLYAFCGWMAARTEHTGLKLSAAAFPLYLAALSMAARRGGPWLVAPPVAMGLLLLGGEPQVALLAAGTGLVWALVVPGARRRALLAGGLSPAIGAALAAVQLLPSMAIVEETNRATPLAEANRWPFTLAHLEGLLVPIDLGPASFAGSTFVGLGALVLALATLVVPRRRTVLALWSVVVVSLWLAAGDDAGLNAWARAIVPLWDRFRYPVKASLPAYLALAMLAGMGFALLSHPRHGTRARLVGSVACVFGLAVLAARTPEGDETTAFTSAVAAIVALGTGGLRRLRPVGATVLFVAALAAAMPVLKTGPKSLYDPPPLARALQGRVSLTGPSFDRVDPGYAASRSVSIGCTDTCINGMFSLPQTSPFMPGAPLRVRRLFEAEKSGATVARMLGLLGTKYVLVTDEIQRRTNFRELARDEAQGLVLVELPQSLPRAYAAHRAAPVSSPRQARQMLLSPGFKPGREIVVETTDAPPSWSARPDRLAVPVEIVARTNATVTLEAELPWDGFVVLNESWTSGWSALVDGEPAALLPANAVVRAVPVPEGRHRIELRYSVPGLAPGAVVSGLTLVVLVFGAGWLRRRAPTTPRVRAP